ncbi:MAG: exo-rhamnogalacturonan lyase family protein, partial [Planctomycetota bacterium]
MRYLTLTCIVLLLFAWHADAATLRISVEEPTGVPRKGWPVTSGVPLAQGALKDAAAAALFTADGREVPLQTEALARWPDGSIRWLLLDFQVDLNAKQMKSFSLRCGEKVRRTPVDKRVRVLPEEGGVVIDAGAIQFSIAADGFLSYPGSVAVDADGDGQLDVCELVPSFFLPGVELIDRTGEKQFVGQPVAPEKIVVEQSGPLRACVLISGHHRCEEEQMFRYQLRIHAFRGRPFVRIFYTFINDYQNSLTAKLQELSLVFSVGVTPREEYYALIGGERGQPESRLLQIDESHYELNGKRVDGRAPGWAALECERIGLAVGLREFWQNWPKAMEIHNETLQVGICPKLPKDLYRGKPLEVENKLYYQLRDGVHTFKVGVARTHELWATFFAGKPDAKRLSQFFRAAEDPLLATCEPAYV